MELYFFYIFIISKICRKLHLFLRKIIIFLQKILINFYIKLYKNLSEKYKISSSILKWLDFISFNFVNLEIKLLNYLKLEINIHSLFY